MVIALIAIGLFALGGVALATTGLNGPTPPELGDPVGTNVSPHGGYSSSTNFCLQCHSVHGYPNMPAHPGSGATTLTSGYALMSLGSVTAVCSTCHSYQGGATPGTPDAPDFGGTLGTASSRSAYDLSTPASGHAIGTLSGPPLRGSNWSYSWRFSGGPTGPSTVSVPPGTSGPTTGGMYCALCHTPHGEFGQLINSEWTYTSAGSAGASPPTVEPWATGTAIWWASPAGGADQIRYLYQANPGDPWEVCTDTTYTTCDYAQTLDAEDQVVSLYGYKLLTSSPNHQYPPPGSPPSGTFYLDDVNRTGARAGVRSMHTDEHNHDGMLFCGTCHSRSVDDSYGGTYHNHPTGCEACHGNPANDATSNDYPHTSSFQYLLQDVPDALCITCHTAGSLP